MLLKFILVSALVVVSSLAEAPLNNRAPYPAAGFRPSKPFDLPGEYYPPVEVDYDQQPPNQGISFEITKQRVDFAGQEVQQVAVSEPQNQYLPPTQPGFVNNQARPDNRRPQTPQFFVHRHGPGRHNRRPTQRPSQQTPQNKPNFTPQFPPNLPPQNIPLPKPTTDERFETQQFFPKNRQPSLEYGAPNNNIDPRNTGQQQQQTEQPGIEYGAPINNINSDNFNQQQQGLEYDSNNQQLQKPALEYGAPLNSQNNNDDELEKQFALDALNAAVENYNRLQENSNDRIAQGQYFVVNPDHSIQKVKFTTKKSDDETKQNDFTAELKYTKVGEINDPLYKYTAEGQLVRIVK